MTARHLILLCVLLAACSRTPPPVVQSRAEVPASPPQQASAPATSEAGPTTPGSQDGETPDSFFDPKQYPDAVQGTFADVSKLTATERKYGVAPKRDRRVTYRPDVILMEQGDQAIREAKSDGMTFSFDAKADHVSEIAVGKVLFATGRVVGRVGQVSRDGDMLTVKLAPVTIIEVVQKGTFMLDSGFNPKDLMFYTAPDFPHTSDVDTQQQSRNLDPQFSEPHFLPAAFVKTQYPSGLTNDLATRILPPPPTLPAPDLNLDKGLDIKPAIGSDGGIGLNFSYIKPGILFNAWGQLVLPAPRIRFLLDIDTSGIKTAGIEISGATSIRMSITARTDIERYVNVNSTNITPIDISLPCPIAGLPLSLSFKTSFNLHTSFGAKRSVLTSSGSWNMHGTMFAGIKGGKQSHDVPKTSVDSSLAKNVSGVSLAINRIGGAIKITPMIGLGGFGFETGVYLGITFTGDFVKQASEAMVDCHGASGSATIDSGVGYSLPRSFVAFLNKMISLFTTYQIAESGTIIHGWGGPLFQVNEDIPTGCAGFKATQT